MGRAMKSAQQIPQRNLKRAIAARTPQPATLSKVLERTATAGTGLAGPRSARRLFRQLLSHGRQKRSQRRLRLRARTLHALFRGAPLAQVQRGDLFVYDLGQVNDRFTFATLLAGHQGMDSTLESGTRRPPSRESTRSARLASDRL